jgi:hypothetical protein
MSSFREGSLCLLGEAAIFGTVLSLIALFSFLMACWRAFLYLVSYVTI